MAKTVREFIIEAEEIIAKKNHGEYDAGQAAYWLTGSGMYIEGKERTPEFDEVFDLVADLELLWLQQISKLSDDDIAKLEEKEWQKFLVLFAQLKEKVGFAARSGL